MLSAYTSTITRVQVLHAAGIERPRAIVVAYTARQRSVLAVESLHQVSMWRCRFS